MINLPGGNERSTDSLTIAGRICIQFGIGKVHKLMVQSGGALFEVIEDVWVPRISSASRDQAIFVNEATQPVGSHDPRSGSCRSDVSRC